MPFNHLILCRPLLLLPSIFPRIRVFSNKSILPIRWPKYWSFSFSIFHEYSGMISFRIDWFDLLAVQGTLKSLLQHSSSHRPLHLLPPIPHSIRVFSNESALPIRWPKYWSFSNSPSNEYSGLISFRIDWFDLLTVQGTLQSLSLADRKSVV